MAIPTETLGALRGVSPEVWAVVPPAVAAIFIKLAAGLRVTETAVWKLVGGKLVGDDKPLEEMGEGLRVSNETMAVLSLSDGQFVVATGPRFRENNPFAVVKNERSGGVVVLSSWGDYQAVANGVAAKYVPDK